MSQYPLKPIQLTLNKKFIDLLQCSIIVFQLVLISNNQKWSKEHKMVFHYYHGPLIEQKPYFGFFSSQLTDQQTSVSSDSNKIS